MRQSVPLSELGAWERQIVETCREQVRKETESRRATRRCERCERTVARAIVFAAIALAANILYFACSALFGWR